MEHYIAYVANQIQLPDGLPIQLSPSATLRRATAEEIDKADSRLEITSRATPIPIRSYRHQFERKETGPSSQFVPNLLPKELWRYHVLDFKGDGLEFRRLQLTLVITEPPIYFVFTTVKGLTTPLNGEYPVEAHILERAERLWWNNPNGQSVDKEQIQLICRTHAELINKKQEFMFAAEAAEKYFDLQRLPPSSDMYLLGLFSVIESLIAHKPRLTENLDSINHQLINKLSLLDECFIAKPIQTTDFFNGISHAKAWKKLYEFRSQLAHTSSSSLPHDLMALQSKEVILRFINAKTKELIRFAIAEPKILRYLKEC